jgi:hypothetical protein
VAAVRQLAEAEARCGRAIVLAIDDANRLPAASRREVERTCEEQAGLHCVLAFSDRPECPAGSIPVASPLTLPELRAYVETRLDQVGADASQRRRFDDTTIKRLHRATAGVPQRVHQQIAHALMREESARTRSVGDARTEGVSSLAEPAALEMTPPEPEPEMAPREPEPRPDAGAIAPTLAMAPPAAGDVPPPPHGTADLGETTGPSRRALPTDTIPAMSPTLMAADQAAIAAIAEELEQKFGRRLPPTTPETTMSETVPARAAAPAGALRLYRRVARIVPPAARLVRRLPLRALAASAGLALVAVGLGLAPLSPGEETVYSTAATLPDVAAPAPVVPPGDEQAAISPSGTAPPAQDRAVESSPGEDPPAPADAGVAQGRINVNALPWAHIRLDGEPIGETPLGEHEVPHGIHVIEAQFPDGRVERREIELGPEEIFVIFR